METIFIAAFPGLFLYTLDCKKVLQAWMIGHKEKYDIEITQESADWCKFRFSFTEPFVKIAYEGFGEKGEQEFQRAKEMEFLFKQKYECTLFSIGYLTAPVNIPEDSSDIIKQMSRTEAKFQLYHVSKALYESITEVEQMNNAEFKLFYTYVGEDGLEGISRKFAKDIKKNLEEDIHNTRTLIHQEQRDIGGFRWFPLSILSPAKWGSFGDVMEHRYSIEKTRVNLFEREFLFLFERIRTAEEKMSLAIATIKEGISMYERIIRCMDKMESLYSFQLGITGTFFTSIGLTLTIMAFFFQSDFTFFSFVAVIALIAICGAALVSLLFYSTGRMIERELDYMKDELQRNRV